MLNSLLLIESWFFADKSAYLVNHVEFYQVFTGANQIDMLMHIVLVYEVQRKVYVLRRINQVVSDRLFQFIYWFLLIIRTSHWAGLNANIKLNCLRLHASGPQPIVKPIIVVIFKVRVVLHDPLLRHIRVLNLEYQLHNCVVDIKEPTAFVNQCLLLTQRLDHVHYKVNHVVLHAWRDLDVWGAPVGILEFFVPEDALAQNVVLVHLFRHGCAHGEQILPDFEALI